MGKISKDIKEQIIKLELQKKELIEQRKEEIGKLFEQIGGLTLDNRLLKGLIFYARDPKNQQSNLLRELMECGSKKYPSKSNATEAS